MKAKKIMMVCEAFGGGVFAYVSQLCNSMCESFDVSLVYAVRPQTPKDYKGKLDPRIHLHEVSEMGNLKSPIAMRKSMIALKRLAAEIQPDVIHLHSSVAGGIGRLAFDKNMYNLVYTPHGYAFILLGGGLKSKAYLAMEKWLGKKRCVSLTCCDSEDEVARTLTSRTAYIETGIDLTEFEKEVSSASAADGGKFTVFTLGRACTQKQPALFNRIAELVPEAKFVWVGNGELENKLTAKNLTVTGWKPREEALSIAKQSDVFILCSLGEAVAMSLLENMYLKKLILVSDVVGNKSVISDGVNGYVCKSAEDYAARIKQAIANFPKELPERAFEDILTTYNAKTMARRYIDFYNNLIERGPDSFGLSRSDDCEKVSEVEN